MAASELNNRLDYLISYSSQLVFVCSDKIPQQSQVVESYLAQQNEQADLALLTANELTPLVTYREKLFRQLISHNQKADFNRPLNQLLAPLNDHNGPILINVFQAEKLPNKLVKELWDLVLQSRFANNKQHLNVLLMGLSNWAESAKASLRSKSREQPIVLNSQIEVQHTEVEEFSDLEALIQDKRKKFAQRLEDRHYNYYESKPVYKNGWMATLIAIAFLGVFAGILGWQYPEKITDILSYIDNHLSTPVEQLKGSDANNSVDSISAESPIPLPPPNTELVDSAKAPTDISATTTPTDMPIAKEVNSKDVLVTDWASASAKLEQQTHKILLNTANINIDSDIKTMPPNGLEASTRTTELSQQANLVNDYKIEDKVEFAPTEQVEEPIDENPIQSQGDEFLSPKPELILALPTKNFVIQLAAMANLDILKDFIREEQLGQQLWLYKTQRYGGEWFVLLKNQQFPSIDDARAEITNLTESLQRNNPFVKSIAQVKKEITAFEP